MTQQAFLCEKIGSCLALLGISDQCKTWCIASKHPLGDRLDVVGSIVVIELQGMGFSQQEDVAAPVLDFEDMLLFCEGPPRILSV